MCLALWARAVIRLALGFGRFVKRIGAMCCDGPGCLRRCPSIGSSGHLVIQFDPQSSPERWCLLGGQGSVAA